MAPASLARCTRARLRSRSPIQNSWKNVFGLAATTSSTATLANELSPIAVPASAAPRATATSPSGCTACTPVGDAITGSEMSCPSTEVAVARVAGRSAMRGGASPSSLKAATLSRRVVPFSLPASRARKTERGSRRRARRRASATVSNHSLVLAIGPPSAALIMAQCDVSIRCRSEDQGANAAVITRTARGQLPGEP